MKIAFTLCSINYLAQAKTLGTSLLAHNPEYRFIIGLVDKLNDQVQPTEFLPLELLEADAIGITDFADMVERYRIVELNTAVKPFFIDYFFRTYHPESVLYFDPDIFVYRRLSDIETELAMGSILLTPHITTPIDDASFKPPETLFLNFGLYNLGFIGLRNTATTHAFIAWWKERLRDRCRIRVDQGMYVDQLWVNLAPIYFANEVTISRNLGFNAAYWNFHERTITSRDGTWWVNNTFPLTFFHFSNFNPNQMEVIAAYTTRTFRDRPDVVPLFDAYRRALLANGYNEWKQIECYYVKTKRLAEEARLQALNSTFRARSRVALTATLTGFFRLFPTSFKKVIARSLHVRSTR